MTEIVWHRLARADLLAIVTYIAEENPDAAQRIKDNIESKVQHLLQFPHLGPKGRVEGTREFVVSTNYILVYQDLPETIRILRVLHAAQQWPNHDETSMLITDKNTH
ncbi:MAG: type II toxin-antitoxin system RelE/ParE family toxin [Pseudomonadota bacterium]